MSFESGTNGEIVYKSLNPGAAKSNFTSEVRINDPATMGVPAWLPPGFFFPDNSTPGKTVNIVAKGILSAKTGTTPKYTITIRGGAAGNTSGIILLGSAQLTTVSGASNQYWELNGDVVLTAIADAGTNSTIRGSGHIISPGLNPVIAPVWGGASSPGSSALLDWSGNNYINVNAACDTADAANSIQLIQLIVRGEN